MVKKITIAYLLLLTLLIFAGCSSGSGAAAAAETYIQALVARDNNQLSALSCAEWEAEARNELESFSAVSIKLSDLSCQESGSDGDLALVECTGMITADYNGEILQIDLSERTYRMLQESGDWRMCGYQ